ncbi:MAG: hypothetical protein DRJ10_14335 [Bacteroidetes bacterium]|nr:MAG: hypothetical protein DRJ10_14335 [Bacteroidota bacterium]
MKFIRSSKILVVSLLISFTACQTDQQTIINEPVNDSVISKEVYELETDEIDELYIIENKTVIFFLLSKKELKELTKELGSSYRYETDFLFNNYTQQAKRFKKLLAKHNIQSELIRNKKFLIKLKNGQTVSFNRIHEDQIMGEIISDGIQDPIIEYGMFSNKELAALVQNYYKIENLGFVEPENIPLDLPAEEKIKTDSLAQIIQ